MNVIVVNENKEIIDKLDIEAIKKIEGQFELSDLLAKFVNLYFNKMIVDITAIQDFEKVETIKNLVSKVDPSRIILLLNTSPIVNSQGYLSELVKMGLYNFTRNIEGIKYLYSNPNTLESVQHFIQSEEYVPPVVEEEVVPYEGKTRIIGLQGMTAHAGASTLTNLMVKLLNQKGVPAKGLEISRQDLMYYHDPNLVSCMSKMDIENTLRQFEDVAAVIVDLNEYAESGKYCDTILYIIEPSYIKMTKMLRRNRNALNDLKDEKVLLNMSFVNDQDVPEFEYETKVKVFGNLPPINDRDLNQPEIEELLVKLGFKLNN